MPKGNQPAPTAAAMASAAAKLRTWDVAAFQGKVADRAFYEAHQIVRAAAQRHRQAGQLLSALALLREAAEVFLAPDVDCQAEAADLLQLAKEYLAGSTTTTTTTTVTTTPGGGQTDSKGTDAVAAVENSGDAADAQPRLSSRVANEQVQLLCGLYAQWRPRTLELARRKMQAIHDLMSLSASVNDGLVDQRVSATQPQGGRGWGGAFLVSSERRCQCWRDRARL
jgi:hypothetical protein